ncbi:MAG TPA: hypothetical protein VLX92_00965 [Kofleriaceae bacterium]|nr:hypothetical protein [Kofleriaceae bacterium]
MRLLVAFALCSGCCENTFEIASDTSKQPIAQLSSKGITQMGTLTSRVVASGYDCVLLVPSADEYVLHVPALSDGSYTTAIDQLHSGVLIATLNVTITTSVTLQQVCMAPDQNDYGTGRCGYSFVGTIAISGDATSTWMLDQIAHVAPGTPDC